MGKFFRQLWEIKTDDCGKIFPAIVEKYPQGMRSRSLREGGAEEVCEGGGFDEEAVVAVGGLDLVVG